MTLMEVISKLDAQKHNTCSLPEKIGWVSQLDAMTCKLLFPEKAFTPYDENTPGDTLLQIPAPFDECYLYWLEGKIDYGNGEISRFNNANAMFGATWQRYCAYVLRTTPQKKGDNRFY